MKRRSASSLANAWQTWRSDCQTDTNTAALRKALYTFLESDNAPYPQSPAYRSGNPVSLSGRAGNPADHNLLPGTDRRGFDSADTLSQTDSTAGTRDAGVPGQ